MSNSLSLSVETSKKTLSRIKILLIDDDEAEHMWVSEQLKQNPLPFELVWKTTVQNGIDYLTTEGANVVLLDLHLPDSQGIETFQRVSQAKRKVPIVILTSLDDEEFGLEAVRSGAQDYLVKGEVDGKALIRIIRYAFHRHEFRSDRRDPRLNDELTGLYNRRGFLIMAERQLKVAKRTHQGFYISLIMVYGYTEIKKEHGKSESDLVIETTAKILEESFRTSDLIARIGEDQFAVITSENSPHAPKVFKSRLQKSQIYYNAQFNRYKFALSLCATHIDHSQIKSVQDLSKKIEKIFTDYQKARVA